MAIHKRSSRSKQASLKYGWVPLQVAPFDLSNVGQEVDASDPDPQKQCSKESETKSSELLTTAEFVSAVGGLWRSANQGLSVFQPKTSRDHSETVDLKNNVLLSGEENKENTLADKGYSNTDAFDTCSSGLINSKFAFISVAQKISMFESCSRHDRHSIVRRCLQVSNSCRGENSVEVNKSASMRVPLDVVKTNRWTNGSPFHVAENKGNLSSIKDENAQVTSTSLHSEYFLRSVTNIEATVAVSRTPSSVLDSDYHIDSLVLDDTTSEESEHKLGNTSMSKSSSKHVKELHLESEPSPEICLLTKDKPNHALAKQRHAFAGALAGTFVSLCLHPVDTIKTVVQFRSMGQKSIYDVVGSITSERGVTGLYRGIASNIASSAPISAVYTFTYESVKAALIPLLHQDHHSFAHCTAGGCASIATSFIFTPSERIKQQMQVSSRYQNCWTALVSILKNGGLPSLYAGWGAVLCRNIPHSIIKFYTYESLKQLFLSSTDSKPQPDTFQTLVCGGLAGSTAALFTTPFDVVKTRLQTEIPGSQKKYDGVFDALIEIGKKEGLKGLYRGLTPRLIMYVSQGAIFFASYECFKAMFCLEVPKPSAPDIHSKENIEEESTMLSMASSTSISSKLPSSGLA